MHQSPAVLWAREGNLGSANVGFDLYIAKHFIQWLRFIFESMNLKLFVPALYFVVVGFIGIMWL